MIGQSLKKKISWGWVIPALIVVVAAVFVALQAFHVTHFFTKGSASTIYYPGPHTTTGGQYTKGSTTGPSIVQSNPSPKTTPNSQQTGSPTTSSNLIAPSGDFVNNHHPTMTGTASNMFSVCNTTPGAICSISFTNTTSGTVKNLPTQSTDSNGSVYWNWTPGQIGLTSGSTWRVTATATLDGQTKSSSDATNLEIQ